MADPQAPQATPPQTSKPDDAAKAQAATADTTRESIREVFERLRRATPDIKTADPVLGQIVDALTRQGPDPLRLNQRSFQHELAYAFQDAERALGREIEISTSTRTEVKRLAGSAPGLENDQMSLLMRSTGSLADLKLIHDIRQAGAEIGGQVDQNTADIRSRIGVLDNRARLAPSAPEPSQQPAARSASGTEGVPAGQAGSAERSDANATQSASRPADAAAQQQRRAQTDQVAQADALNTLFRAMRGNGQGTAPWDPAPTPFADRLNNFQNTMRAGRDDISLRDAEKAGRAALDALEGLRTGEGATVMNRIQAASRSEPGGMAGVLSEMREGGRFADLRQQFNNALSDEKGFARAYDRAASALAEYGQARTGIEQIIGRRPDATNLSARFEQLDAQIGDAAGNTPSRREGRNMVDDIAKQAGEIISRAVDAVRSMFNRNSPEVSQPSASPSMST